MRRGIEQASSSREALVCVLAFFWAIPFGKDVDLETADRYNELKLVSWITYICEGDEPMAKPNVVSKADLLASAKRCIAEDGIGKLTLKAVAEGAGVTQGTVFYHFRTKDQLLFEIVKDLCESSWNDLNNRTVSLECREGIGQALQSARSRCQYRSFYHQLFYSLVVAGFQQADIRKQLGTLLRMENDRLSQLLDGAGQRTEELPSGTAAILINALIDGLALQALLNEDFPVDDAYDAVERLCNLWFDASE
ncbi:HTH-type transcriptional regulator BetI [Paenibacillus sp. CECT 9249]|nr:HTH-type transcriptional regulator BetI [Paenibacillus sp. CECT 9249]